MISRSLELQKPFSLDETPKENEVAFSMILKDELNFLKSNGIDFNIESDNEEFFLIQIEPEFDDVEKVIIKVLETYKKLECLSHLTYSVSSMLMYGIIITLKISHPESIDEFGFIQFLKENKIK